MLRCSSVVVAHSTEYRVQYLIKRKKAALGFLATGSDFIRSRNFGYEVVLRMLHAVRTLGVEQHVGRTCGMAAMVR